MLVYEVNYILLKQGISMKKSKNAFTMIELVFVIVVLGILAAVAIPKFAATRTDAEISKARSDIASIRSAIVTERQSRLIKGDSTWITKLSTGAAGDNLFTGSDVNNTLLTYGIAADEWQRTNDTTYTYTSVGTVLTFTYDNLTGIFTCSTTAGSEAQDTLCKKLIN